MIQQVPDLEYLAYYAERLAQLHRGKRFHEKQQDVIRAIFQDGYKRLFARKGRKGGGTQTAIYPNVRMAGCFPGLTFYMIYPTLKLGKEILWESGRLEDFIPKEWNARFTEDDTRVTIPNRYGRDSWIKVEGADNYKSLIGIEADGFTFDELKDHDPRAYKNCYPNTASRDAFWFVLGAPPREKNNFYYKLETQIRQEKKWFFINWSIWANAEFLPGGEEWIRNEKDTMYRAGDWDEWQVEWEARYCFGGKHQVIPSFDADQHVEPLDVLLEILGERRGRYKWYAIFDPGFGSVFAVLFACIDPYTARVYFLDEIYETDRKKLSAQQIWDRVVDIQAELNPGGSWINIYDSAAPGFPQEIRNNWEKWKRDPKLKPKFRPTIKHENDEDTYFRILNSVFHTGKGRLSQRCRAFRNEIENYLTDENGKFPDRFNHTLDDARYLLKMAGYSKQQAQATVKVISENPGVSLEQGLREAQVRKDWAHAIVEQDGNAEFQDDGFDFNF